MPFSFGSRHKRSRGDQLEGLLITAERADRAIGDLVRAAPSQLPDAGDIPMTRVASTLATTTTDLGSVYMPTGAAVVLALSGRPRVGVQVLAAGALGWMTAQSAKHVVQRRRPYEHQPELRLIRPPTGSSMPSGHAAVATAVATVMSSHSHKQRRWPWKLLPIWVSWTRVQTGVHYPGDTIAGAALGWFVGKFVLIALESSALKQPED